jgi:hypothetical protein
MTAAKEYDSVRTTVAAESIFDGRAIPAGVGHGPGSLGGRNLPGGSGAHAAD